MKVQNIGGWWNGRWRGYIRSGDCGCAGSGVLISDNLIVTSRFDLSENAQRNGRRDNGRIGHLKIGFKAIAETAILILVASKFV